MLSIFQNSFAAKPLRDISIDDLLHDIKIGTWKKPVLQYRETKNKKIKAGLQAVTVSVSLKSRDKKIPIEKRIRKHSGFIAVDIDAKDNPKMSTAYAIDPECYAQFLSCSGEGLKIIYRCKPTTDSSEHWRIFDAIEKRLKEKKLTLKVDAIVKSIASLQYVSYDPDPYINTKTKLVIQPLKAIKRKKSPAKSTSLQINTEIKKLSELVDMLGKKDITTSYEDWNIIAFGLSYSLNEHGRNLFHRISKNYKGYSASECDEQYDYCLERIHTSPITNPVTIASVYDLLHAALGKSNIKQQLTVKGRTVDSGVEVKEGELAGMVKYKLFMFKKVVGKDKDVKALLPFTVNPIEFGKLLNAKGFYRYERNFVHIQNNIVEQVDTHTILWQVSEHIQADGDYNFTYNGEEYFFSWEDLLYLWKTIKGNSKTHYTIPSDLVFWEPKLLKDTQTESFIPYQNGVVKITAKKMELLHYKDVGAQIWKDRILPREFKYTKNLGMFEKFFANVTGRGKEPLKSEEFKCSLWYFGYMLHGYKDPAMSRAWMLYDIHGGNNGGSGKSIIGQALGKIRFVTTIDGKHADLRNRFWLQAIQPWTDIIFIDDPDKRFTINPLFNMITGSVQADRKGLMQLEIWCKWLFASNYIMESEGVSETRRQFITQVSDFYTRYAKENNSTVTPIVHYHGKRFFTEWNTDDWNQFDSFAVRALQNYYGTPPPKDTIMGSSKRLRFIQENSEETHHDLLQEFKRHCDKSDMTIPRDLLIGVLRDGDNTITPTKAGKIVRSFLDSLDSGKITVTTKPVAGRGINVYKLAVRYEMLNFGNTGIEGLTGGKRPTRSRGVVRQKSTK